jgi:hypothetical protein
MRGGLLRHYDIKYKDDFSFPDTKKESTTQIVLLLDEKRHKSQKVKIGKKRMKKEIIKIRL